MFIQVISGKVNDVDAMQRHADKWQTELTPGRHRVPRRHPGHHRRRPVRRAGALRVPRGGAEEQRAARAGQVVRRDGEGTSTTSRFHDCSRIETLFGGGKDDAKFVQVMQGRVKDRAKADAMFKRAAEAEKVLGGARPDVIGEVVAIHDDGDAYTDAVYFSSEAEARGQREEADARGRGRDDGGVRVRARGHRVPRSHAACTCGSRQPSPATT